MNSEVIPIHNSDQSGFQSCRRAWDLSSILRQAWRPIEMPQPLKFGLCMHVAYQEFYNLPTRMANYDLKVRLMQSAFIQAMKKVRDEYLRLTGKECLDDEQQVEYDELMELGINMCVTYIQKTDEWNQTIKVLGVEEDWEVPLGFSVKGVPVVFRFRTDLRVEDMDGDQWLVDHKTAAQLRDVDFLDMDPQMGKYLWGLRELGMPVVGAVYNEQYKGWPQPPMRLKVPRKGLIFSTNKMADTTYELYIEALDEAGEPHEPYQEYLDWLKTSQTVKQWVRRTLVRRNPYELAAIGEQTKMIAIDQLNDPLIYTNPSRFKCNWCAFRAVCLQMNDGSDWEETLRTNYKKVDTHYGHAV